MDPKSVNEKNQNSRGDSGPVKDHPEHAGKTRKTALYKSFGYAFQGIWAVMSGERNFKIHMTVAALVVIAGLILKISRTEWLICLVLFALVMSLEILNTSIESVVDLVTVERKPLAKKAKDTAAGAVLVAAIFAAIIGLMIFVPKVF